MFMLSFTWNAYRASIVVCWRQNGAFSSYLASDNIRPGEEESGYSSHSVLTTLVFDLMWTFDYTDATSRVAVL